MNLDIDTIELSYEQMRALSTVISGRGVDVLDTAPEPDEDVPMNGDVLMEWVGEDRCLDAACCPQENTSNPYADERGVTVTERLIDIQSSLNALLERV